MYIIMLMWMQECTLETLKSCSAKQNNKKCKTIHFFNTMGNKAKHFSQLNTEYFEFNKKPKYKI